MKLGRVLANSFNITCRMLENVIRYIISTIRFVKPKSLTAIFQNIGESEREYRNCDRITMVICKPQWEVSGDSRFTGNITYVWSNTNNVKYSE